MAKKKQTEKIIGGDCPDFICVCCRTKYGWAHQTWCDKIQVLKPYCKDCGYFNVQSGVCNHPVHKHKRKGTKEEVG